MKITKSKLKQIIKEEYDNLLESSPNIDLDIISMFNKKFNDKYPDVRKPIICNGLKAIKPYNDNKTANEVVEPEPEPEIIIP